MILAPGTFASKKYARLFVGAILGWIAYSISELVDTFLSGIYLGSDAVAAIEIVTPIYTMIYALSLFAAIGGSISYNTELGAFNIEKSKKIAGMTLLISVIISAILGLTLFLGKDFILSFYECSPEIGYYASKYYDPFIGVGVLSPIFWCLYRLIAIDGDEVIILLSDLTILLVNSVLSFIFINYFGIMGLGLGTLVAYGISFLVLITHFLKKRNSISFKFYFKFKDFLDISKYAIPTMAIYFYTAVVDLIFNKIIIELFTDAYLPAYAVVNMVLNLAAITASVGQCNLPFITVARGEHNNGAIKNIHRIGNRYEACTSIILTLIIMFTASFFPSILGITDPLVVKASVLSARIIPITYIVTGFIYEYCEYYIAMSKMKYSIILNTCYGLAFPLILAYPLACLFGYSGLIIGFTLIPVFTVLAFILYTYLTKELKGFPFFLTDYKVKEKSLDIELKLENIIEARNIFMDFLKENKVSESIINESMVLLEDSLVYISKYNRKKVYAEILMSISDDTVKLITKDNGKIFDITKRADTSKAIQLYVVKKMMDTADEKVSMVTISFNRNVYSWNI